MSAYLITTDREAAGELTGNGWCFDCGERIFGIVTEEFGIGDSMAV